MELRLALFWGGMGVRVRGGSSLVVGKRDKWVADSYIWLFHGVTK
jgi:hypothetical protein